MPILGITASSILKVSDTGAILPLQVITVGPSGASSITFSNIPATYNHLQVRILGQTNRGTYGTDSYYMRFNSDTGSNYNSGFIRGNGSSPAAYHANGNQSLIEIGSALGTTTASSYTFGVSVIDILDYSNTNKHKTLRALTGTEINGTIAGYGGFVYLTSGLWRSANAISSIQFTFDNTVQPYSSFALYGIKAA